MAKILTPDQIDQAVEALHAGQLVAFPTETVYGLGADATRAEAVAQIFEVKGRPTVHPLIVHLGDIEWLDRFGTNLSYQAKALAEAFWPGPLTIIVSRRTKDDNDLANTDVFVADETVGGKSTIGLRVPDHPVTLDLLRRFGRGVAGPSANTFGGVSPTTAQHVVDDLGSNVAFVVDGGPSAIGVESTIVDVSTNQPTLLRPGGISTVELEGVLGVPMIDGRSGPSRAPGMMISHYSPQAKVELVTAAELRTTVETALAALPAESSEQRSGSIGVIAPQASRAVSGRSSDATVTTWDMPSDAGGYAAQLYAVLRQVDVEQIGLVYVVPPDTGHLRDAVVDRLQKAAADKRAQNR